MVNYNKPLGISLMAYFLFLLAFIMIPLALYVYFYEDEFWHHGLLQYINSDLQVLFMVLFIAILLLISGVGLLKSAQWGRGLLIALCAMGGIHGLILNFSEFFRGILIVIICGIVAAYMLTSGVSDEFSSIDTRKAVDAIDTLESYRKSRFF
ncbi:MAG: hypothetical protein JSV09_14095 [Thermoplasmata archaeon]|nr:MAG: hypothetical protein JSV09_14095 [Thermoplasmata archaeon]